MLSLSPAVAWKKVDKPYPQQDVGIYCRWATGRQAGARIVTQKKKKVAIGDMKVHTSAHKRTNSENQHTCIPMEWH